MHEMLVAFALAWSTRCDPLAAVHGRQAHMVSMSQTSPPPRSKVPARLAEWGMDVELWNKVENKRNLLKMMKRDEEDFARARIVKLRQLIEQDQRTDDSSSLAEDGEVERLTQQLASLKAELAEAKRLLAFAGNDASQLAADPLQEEAHGEQAADGPSEALVDQEDDLLQVECPALGADPS